MLFTIFCCISTGLCVYCILARVNKQSTRALAVHAAVHEVKKEFQARNGTMVSQLATKERELTKARELVKLHEAVPTPAAPPASATAKAGAAATASPPHASAASPAAAAKAKAKAKAKADLPQGLDMFAMSRPFTDTSFDALMAVSDVVRVEPKAN